MIDDVDVAIRDLMRREALGGDDSIDIEFDAPTTEWASRQNSPTIDVFLYDITEETKRRTVMFGEERGADRIVTARRIPPRIFRLAYLITAWTQRPEDEHRLLSAVISCFLENPIMPEDLVPEPILDLEINMPMTIALPRPEDRQAIDVWSSLGGELKPSLDLVVHTPLAPMSDTGFGPPVLEETRLSVSDGEASEDVQGRPGQAAGETTEDFEVEENFYGGHPPDGKVPAGAFGDGRTGRAFVARSKRR